MWLLPPMLSRLKVPLRAGRYLIPWYYDDAEVDRLLELVACLVQGVRYRVRIDDSALPLPPGRRLLSPRQTVAAVTVDPRSEAGLRLDDLTRQVACRWLLVRVPTPRELGYAWQERYLKAPLVSRLGLRLSDRRHPLASMGISSLPVLEAARLTAELPEYVEILEATLAHRLRYAREGTGPADYRRSLLVAAGRRLGSRLLRLPVDLLPPALELVLTPDRASLTADPLTEAAEGLERLGLARTGGGGVALGPLARAVPEAPAWVGLLDVLPKEAWTDAARERLWELTRKEPAPELDTGPSYPDLPATSPFTWDASLVARLDSLAGELLPGDRTAERATEVLGKLARAPAPSGPLPRDDAEAAVAASRTLEHVTHAPPGSHLAELLRALLSLALGPAGRGPRQRETDTDALLRIAAAGAADPRLRAAATAAALRALLVFTDRQPSPERHAWVSERRRALGGCPPDSGPAAVDLHVLDARLLAGEGQIDEAESKLRAALDARRELETGERDWRLPYELGVLAARRSRYELAESRFTEARTLLTPGTDGTSRARVALRLAEVTLAQGKRGVAVRHFHRAHTTLEGLEDRAARAHGVLQLGRIAESKGELGEAIRCGRQALDTLLELQDEAGISGACEQLGRACYRAGAYDEGGDWIRRALEARDKLGDRLGKARARHGLGLIAAAVGDPARADRLLSQAADGYRELGRHGPLARLLRRRGRLAEAGQDSDGARSHYEQALELDRTAGDWEGVGASAGRLADLLLELGEPAEALPRAVLAAEAAVRWPTRADPEAAFVRLDRVRQALGDDVLRAYLAEHPEEPSVRRRLQGWLER